MKKALIDSGPLIALFDSSDKFHKPSVEFIRENKFELYTTLSVITEVTYLLDFDVRAQSDFLKWIGAGAVKMIEVSDSDLLKISELMRKYSDLPMDFADGTLLIAMENIGIKEIATIDSDFHVYRLNGKVKIKNIFQ